MVNYEGMLAKLNAAKCICENVCETFSAASCVFCFRTLHTFVSRSVMERRIVLKVLTNANLDAYLTRALSRTKEA